MPGQPTSWRAHYLDGRTAARRAATVHLMSTGLRVTLEGGAEVWWPFTEIRQTQGSYAGEHVRLERGGPAPEVLLISDPAFLSALRAAAPALGRRFHDPGRRSLRIRLTVLAGFLVVGLSAALYLWGIPAATGLVAARVPVSWEARLGEAVGAHLAPPARRCTEARRQAAIDAIMTRLLATVPDTPYRFRVIVVDEPMVNAFAMPGGFIVLMRGLVERASTPEELAGVLAHEIQHVVRRHATHTILRQASTGLLLAAVVGDVSGVMGFGLEGARTLGSLAYSRRAEEEADRGGLQMLLAASVDPRGMVAFFESLRATERGLPHFARYLSTHPPSADRAAELARLAAGGPGRYAPLLTPGEWADVVRICRPA